MKLKHVVSRANSYVWRGYKGKTGKNEPFHVHLFPILSTFNTLKPYEWVPNLVENCLKIFFKIKQRQKWWINVNDSFRFAFEPKVRIQNFRQSILFCVSFSSLFPSRRWFWADFRKYFLPTFHHSLPRKWVTKIELIGHIKKRFYKNRYWSFYSRLAWHMKSHML